MRPLHDHTARAYDMKRDLVELNYKAAQWAHRAVWNQRYMEPRRATIWANCGQTTLQSRSLSGRHVSTGFLDPVLGALMKQVCWHSRRSKAYRGLPEARMAGATVEETAFEDVNMWQAPVSQKPPLMGT